MRPRVTLWRIAALAALIPTSTAHANPQGPEPAPGTSPWLPRGEAERLADVPLGRAVWRPSRGLEIASADGRFSLNFSAWAHLLYTARREAIPAAGADPWTQNLELRRAHMIVSGRLLAPFIDYTVALMFSPKDLGFKGGTPRRAPIFQAFTTWSRYRHANIQAGFFF